MLPAEFVLREASENLVDSWLSERSGEPKEKVEHVLVAREQQGDQAIIGAIQGHTLLGGTWVNLVVVRKDWRFKRGVGKTLISQLFQLAKKAKPHPSRFGYLETFDFMTGDYYSKIGFDLDCSRPGWNDNITAHFFSTSLDTYPVFNESPDFKIEILSDPSSGTEANAVQEFFGEIIQKQEVELKGRDSGDFEFAFEAVIENSTESESKSNRVGAVSCISFWGGLLFKQIAVEESHQKNGVGRALVDRALTFGRDRGCSIALANVFTFQGLAFWEKLGFVEFGRVKGFHNNTELVRLALDLKKI